MQNEEHDAAFFLFPMPRLREIRLAPPMPKRFASAVMNINRGMDIVAAAT